MHENLNVIHEFIKVSERLKTEMRHSWLSDGRQESVAEHTWRMSLMAILLHGKLSQDTDLFKTLKMIIVHDLVEIYAGDVSATDLVDNASLKRQKAQDEAAAIEKIASQLGSVGQEIKNLWVEFEKRETPEALFAVALDKLEVQIQHNQADLATWVPVEFKMIELSHFNSGFDSLVDEYKNLIVSESKAKVAEGKN
ncbi:HD domain-containing protein [Alteromonas oceanisediminis]|uniref:HD domain-containing protein n=1 Tax=Alteromonas oceanisediminis TaxID=2836180 RepID=UPI001BDB4930|nr:HD domain-containing protein [Alteromonas oceanisediminis]MBT0587067.1 HD domain-containing protein [Alteromonas oceanisediminis]